MGVNVFKYELIMSINIIINYFKIYLIGILTYVYGFVRLPF